MNQQQENLPPPQPPHAGRTDAATTASPMEDHHCGDGDRDRDHHHHHHPPFAVDDRVYCVDANDDDANTSSATTITTGTAAANHGSSNGGSNQSQPHPPPHEAVVRSMRYDARNNGGGGGWSFRVHYPGWNRRWDRWVAADRLVRAAEAETTTTTQEQRETGNCAAAAVSNNNSKRRRGSGSEPRGGATKRVRSGSPGGALEQPQQPQQQQQWLHDYYFRDCCELPLALRTVLVEERERICGTACCCGGGSATTQQQQRLVHALPAAVPVSKVLQHFARRQTQLCWKRQQKMQSSQDGTSATNTALTTPELVQSFCQGLQRLLAAALPACLLYPHERPQYEAFCRNRSSAPDSPPAADAAAVAGAYGCEYLLRLVVRLPGLLGPPPPATANANATANECWSSPAAAGPLLAELLALLQRNRQALFAGTIGGGGGEHGNYRPPLPHELCEWERRPRQRQQQRHSDDNNHHHRKTSSAHEKRQQPGMASPPTSMDTR